MVFYKKFYCCLIFAIFFSAFLFVSGSNAQEAKVHKNSLSIITIGSGVPGGCFSNRAEAMTVIQNKGRYIVLDCGYTSVMKLIKENIPVRNIDIFMFTHLHADHSSDFFNFMLWRFLYGGRELEIIGPPRTRDYYDFYRKFYKDDIMYRAMVFNTGTVKGSLKGVNVKELKGSKKIKVGDLRIESTEMVHCMYTLAYKFYFDNKIVVVSGDTSYTKNLVDFAKNVDMLVLDGSFILYALAPPKVYNFDVSGLLSRKYDGKSYKDYKPEKYAGNFKVESHLNYADIIKISAEIGAKQMILTHLFHSMGGKPDPQTKELKNKVISDLEKAGYKGEVYFAEDGLEVDVK